MFHEYENLNSRNEFSKHLFSTGYKVRPDWCVFIMVKFVLFIKRLLLEIPTCPLGHGGNKEIRAEILFVYGHTQNCVTCCTLEFPIRFWRTRAQYNIIYKHFFMQLQVQID